MSDKYRSNFPMSLALDQLIVQFLDFVTATSETVTITDANGNPISVTSLGSAAGTGVPASAVVAISNTANDAFAAATAASGLAASASSDAASAISITTGYQSAIDSAVAASNSATGQVQQAQSDALGASGYAGQAYSLAQQAESDAQGASAYAGEAYSLAASAMSVASSGAGNSATAKLPIQPADNQPVVEYPSGAYVSSTPDGTQVQTSAMTVSGALTVDSPSTNSRPVSWKVDGSTVAWMSNDGTISTDGYITFIGYKDKSITTSGGDLAFYNAAMTKVTIMDDDGNWTVTSQTPLANTAGSTVSPYVLSVGDQTSSGTISNEDHLEFIAYRSATGEDWTSAGWRIQRVVDSTTEAWIQLGYGYNNDPAGGAIGGGSKTAIAWDSSGNAQFLGAVTVEGPGSVMGSSTSSQSALSLQSSGSASTLVISDTGVNGANLKLQGDGATTPSKTIRVRAGKLEFINAAYSAVITTIDDGGSWTTAGNITAQAITANNGFNVGTGGQYVYASDANGSLTFRVGLGNGTYPYKYFTLNTDGDLQILNGNITAASSITLNGKSLTVDGSGNLSFNPPVLYNNAGFKLGVGANYWTFATDGTLTTAGDVYVPGFVTVTASQAINGGTANVGGLSVGSGANGQIMLRGNGGYPTIDYVLANNTAYTTGIMTATAMAFNVGAATFNSSITTNSTISAGSFFNTWPQATGTIANSGGGGNYGIVAHANNNGGSSATSCAAMTFIRDGLFGCYFGLDTDNVLKIGGWSFGNVAYRVVHEGLSGPVFTGDATVSSGNRFVGGAFQSSNTSLSPQTNPSGAAFRAQGNYGGGFGLVDGSYGISLYSVSGNLNFGFGTSSSVTGKAAINSDGSYVVNGSGGIRVGYNSGSSNSIDTNNWFRSSGNTGWYSASYGIGIYAIDATYVRTYNNAQMVAADFVLSSDRRLKARIRDFEYRGRLRPVNYFHLVNGADEFGFISQEVQELYPEIVGADPNDGMLNLSYEKITAILSAQLNRTEDDLIALRKEFDEYRASRENTLWKRLVKRVAKFFNFN